MSNPMTRYRISSVVAIGATVVIVAVSGSFARQDQPDNSEVAWQSRDDEHLIELFTVGGRPINLNADDRVKVLVNHGYVVGYSEERRNPLWSAYKASKLSSGEDERFDRPQFFPRDPRTNPAVDGRTFGGGFDRGHMVPNAVIGTQYGTLAQAETFFMSNMCPQHKNLNQGPWQRLEKWIIETAQDKKHLFVIAGPIFGDDPDIVTHGSERGIQIPEAFYMIVVDTDSEWHDKPEVDMIAYRFPQSIASNADFKDRSLFGTSVNAIEDETGLDFFPLFAKMFNNWEDTEDEVEMTHWQ